MSNESVAKELVKLKGQRMDIKLLISVYQRKLEDVDRKIKELEQK